MLALSTYYQYFPIIVAVFATALVALLAPKWAVKTLVYVSSFAIVGFSGYTIFRVIETGGAKTGFHLPFAVVTLGGAILLTKGWITLENWMDQRTTDSKSVEIGEADQGSTDLEHSVPTT